MTYALALDVLVYLLVCLLVCFSVLQHLRLKRMEALWKVIGTLSDADLLALTEWRKSVKRLESRAEEDARLEARRKMQGVKVPPPSEKKGRSSDSL